MKQFISFVRKEYCHIFRDTRTIMILLVIPIVQIILFGFAITNEVKNIEIAVLDPSKDVSTQKIVEKLSNSEYFNISEILNTPNQIDQIFKKGKVGLVVAFSENFNENLLHTGESTVQFITDATDPNQAKTVSNYATSIIMSYQQELMQEFKVPYRIIPEIRMLYNPQIKSAYNFVPGVMGMILMLICSMMTSISIVREKETGTMEVLLASPMKPIYIIIAKAIPYFTLSMVNLCTILLLSVFVLKVPIAGSLFWLIITSLLFILVALSLGLMVSTMVDNQLAAMLVSTMGFIIPVMLLSGMVFPAESMPEILQWFSRIVPATWYISAVKKLMIAGLGVDSVIKEISILIFMAIAILFVSVKNFKKRLE